MSAREDYWIGQYVAQGFPYNEAQLKGNAAAATEEKQIAEAAAAKAEAKADAAEAAKANTSIVSGSAPWNGVSSVTGVGASQLAMSASDSAFQPSYIPPAGGVPAPGEIPLVSVNKNWLFFAAIAVGAFFLLRRGI